MKNNLLKKKKKECSLKYLNGQIPPHKIGLWIGESASKVAILFVIQQYYGKT